MSRPQRFRPFFLLAFLSIAWAWVVYGNGGLDLANRQTGLLALGVLGLIWRISARSLSEPPPLERKLSWLVSLLPAYALLQIIPLPLILMRILSPARAELEFALRPVVPDVAWAPLSIHPPATMAVFLLIAGCTLIFLITRDLVFQFSSRPWTVMVPVIVVAALQACGCLFQTLSQEDTGWRGTFANQEYFANLLAMCLPFAVMYPVTVLRRLDLRRGAPPLRPMLLASLFFILAALILLGIVYSTSRMGFLASLLSLLWLGIVAWGMHASPLRRYGLAAALLMGAALGIALIPPEQRQAQLASARETVTGEDRWLVWNESLPLVRQYPVFGSGLGTFETAYVRYKVSSPMVTVHSADSDYLQLLIEMGTLGFALAAALAVAVVAKGKAFLSPHVEPETRFLSMACVASLLALLLESCVHSNLASPGNAMLAAWVAGVCCGLPFVRTPWQKRTYGLPSVVETHAYSAN